MNLAKYTLILIMLFPTISYGHYIDTDSLPIVKPRQDFHKKEIIQSYNKVGKDSSTFEYSFVNQLVTEKKLYGNGKLRCSEKYFYTNKQLSKREKFNAEGKLEAVSSYIYEGNKVTIHKKPADGDYATSTILFYNEDGKLMKKNVPSDEAESLYKRNDRGDSIEIDSSGIDGGGILIIKNTYGKNNKVSKREYFETMFYDGPGSGEKKYKFTRYFTYYETGKKKEIYTKDDKTGKTYNYNLYKYEYPENNK